MNLITIFLIISRASCLPITNPPFMPNQTGYHGQVVPVDLVSDIMNPKVMCCNGQWGAWPINTNSITSVLDYPSFGYYIALVSSDAPVCSERVFAPPQEINNLCPEGSICRPLCISQPPSPSCVAQAEGVCRNNQCRSTIQSSKTCETELQLPVQSEDSCVHDPTRHLLLKCCQGNRGIQTPNTTTLFQTERKNFYGYSKVEECQQDTCPHSNTCNCRFENGRVCLKSHSCAKAPNQKYFRLLRNTACSNRVRELARFDTIPECEEECLKRSDCHAFEVNARTLMDCRLMNDLCTNTDKGSHVSRFLLRARSRK